MKIHEHSLELLEFKRAFALMTQYHISERARNLDHEQFLDKREFYGTVESLGKLKKGSEYFRTAILDEKDYAYARVEDIDEILEDLMVEGSVLGLDEIITLTRAFSNILESISFVRRSRGRLSALKIDSLPLADEICELDATGEQTLRYIGKYIDPHIGLKENDIPSLVEARNRIGGLERDMRSTAQKLVREHEGILSGEFSTIRDGRIVLPLKADFKGKVPGFIHASSQTGSTIFVEPWELAEKNNDLSLAHANYQAELVKIMREISGRIRLDLGFWQKAYGLIDKLSFFIARVRFGFEIDGQFILPSDELRLLGARHLLLGKKAIGIDIEIEKSTKFLVLSGPNTGGKTVSLKTLGLLILLQQSACPLPVKPGSSLPLFSNILVDIGDEQSIDSSLSTFSAHLKRISECLAGADKNSLLLLDELGSGTDPDEGGALAMAIAEHCIEHAGLTLVTSHYMSLKAFAHANPAASNASMAFDDTGKQPKYAIIQGMPGQSHALEIARTIGFDAHILDRALEIKASKGNPANDLIVRLSQEYQNYQDLNEIAREKDKELAREIKTAKDAQKQLSQEKRLLAQEYKHSVENFMKESRRDVEKAIRSMYENLRDALDGAELKKLQTSLREVLTTQESLAEGIIIETQDSDPDFVLEVGDYVKVEGGFQEGKILGFTKKGDAELDVLGKRMSVPLKKLVRIAKPESKKSSNMKPIYELGPQIRAQLTLDLRGLRGEEAIEKLQNQIDAACIQGLSSFSIIHGKGDGILQKLCHEILKSRKDIKTFVFARPEDGGTGKTNVELVK